MAPEWITIRPLTWITIRTLLTAAHLAIPILALTEVAASSDGARHFLSVDPGAFSRTHRL